MNAAAPAASTISAPALPTRPPDFSDRLSPMLVKELRQGMRARLFIWALIGMNATLTLTALFIMSSAESGAGAGDRVMTAWFWIAVSVALCGLLPARALNALASEISHGTLDCLVLTRLTGWRVALGKWLAVAAQQALIAVTVLPYLVVRYFNGGVNPLQEMWGLLLLFVGGATASAVLTGISWIRHFLSRAFWMLAVMVCSIYFCGVVITLTVSGEGFFGAVEQYGWRGGLLMAAAFLPAAHLCYITLDIGAQRVGPLVENHAAPRRVIGLAVLFLYAGAGWLARAQTGSFPGRAGMQLVTEPYYYAWMALLTAIFLIVQALIENPVNLRPVLWPFVKRGLPGCLFGRWAGYPGWPSGVRYALLVMGILFLLERATQARGSIYDLLEIMESPAPGLFGMLAVPLVVYRWFLKNRVRWNMSLYVGILALTGLLHAGLSLLNHEGDGAVFLPALALPSTGFWMRMFDQGIAHRNTEAGFLTLVSCIAWWMAAVFLSARGLKDARRVEKELQTSAENA